MPISPLHQGCPATQSSVSQPSAASFVYGSKAPSDLNRPRTSCTTQA